MSDIQWNDNVSLGHVVCVEIIVRNIYDVWCFQNMYKMFYLNFFVISILLPFY